MSIRMVSEFSLEPLDATSQLSKAFYSTEEIYSESIYIAHLAKISIRCECKSNILLDMEKSESLSWPTDYL